MPVEFTLPVTFRGELQRLSGALEQITDPQVIAAALRRGARLLEEQMRIHVSGPRPRRLDVVTGELRASFETDASDLPDSIRVGTPLFFAAFHELGARGIGGTARSPGRLGRSGGGLRARPFVQPALEIALERMPDILIEELERARDTPA